MAASKWGCNLVPKNVDVSVSFQPQFDAGWSDYVLLFMQAIRGSGAFQTLFFNEGKKKEAVEKKLNLSSN